MKSKRLAKKYVMLIEQSGCYYDATCPDYGCGLSGDDAISAALSCAVAHKTGISKLIYKQKLHGVKFNKKILCLEDVITYNI